MNNMSDYRIEIESHERAWSQMQVVMIARVLNASGEVQGYFSIEDLPEVPNPQGRTTRLHCSAGTGLALYLYIIPHTLPETRDIYDTPPLQATLTLYQGATRKLHQTLEVNPWGGLSRIFHLGTEPRE